MPMDMMPAEAVSMRSAFDAMPPLIKGYLRAGAKIGDGCVIDMISARPTSSSSCRSPRSSPATSTI